VLTFDVGWSKAEATRT
jgi:hypothetical protein